ncbi:phage tail protein [Cronobacter sakazakii]|nr:phage tail protein [Cronobacter sakazakii]EGT4327018.1 phage tail protein [Cronobacter sakazakii]EGT4364596.1 phage tail protein [Cronobacter sakazakii]
MTAKYFAILTNQGAARLANAAALGTKLNLTQMAVGDANGTLPTPDPAQTKLINQKRIAPLNMLSVDPANTSQIIAEQIIPETEGGFWIREIGLYDEDGVLIAVANCPETYKPQLQEGSGRTQTIRMILIVSNTAAVTLKIDPSVVLATRKYVDDEVIEVRQYAEELMEKHIADADPHPQYLEAAVMDKYFPVGFPLPWPQAAPPDGWLKCNGAAFDKVKYPKLAVAYPAGVLPDLRGEFLRGWDDSRGVDSGRALMTRQQGSLMAISVSANTDDDRVSVMHIYSPPSYEALISGVGMDSMAGYQKIFGINKLSSDRLTPEITSPLDITVSGHPAVGGVSRPRNVSFNYIVRAA